MMQSREEIRNKLAGFISENYVDIMPKKRGIGGFFNRKSNRTLKEVKQLSDKPDEFCGEIPEKEETGKTMPCPPHVSEQCISVPRASQASDPPVSAPQVSRTSVPPLSAPRALRESVSPTPTSHALRNSSLPAPASYVPASGAKRSAEMDDFLKTSFEEDGVAKRLNLYMYERDITTAMIYKRCFVDRKLISKITSGKNYHPSKNTMLALCIGLQLNLQEGEEFLLLAGYSFSNASKYDLIIKFMLQNEIYDLDTINEMLYLYEQPCIGA